MDLGEEIEKAKQYCECASAQGDLFGFGYYRGVLETLKRLQKSLVGGPDAKPATEYPQAAEDNEYRHISPAWLDEIAAGLTAGAKKYPGETWRSIPAQEHAARAIRHLNLYRMGDRQDNHLINASMRCMMAYCEDRGEI